MEKDHHAFQYAHRGVAYALAVATAVFCVVVAGLLRAWMPGSEYALLLAGVSLTAFHMDRFILPCVTDDAPLPQFFGHPVYLDLRTAGDDALARLVRAAETAPDSANPVPPVVASPSPELLHACDRLATGQEKVNAALSIKPRFWRL